MIESRTKSMKYDIDMFSPKEDILYCIRELAEIKSFKDYMGTHAGLLNRDHLIRYIVLLYSEDSILNKRPPLSLDERKNQAATIAGFEKGKKGWPKRVVDDLFNLEGDYVVTMIHDYLVLQKNFVWSEICTIEQMVQEFTKIRLSPIVHDAEKGFDINQATKKEALTSKVEDLLEKLDKYYKDFYKHHEQDQEKLQRRRTRIEDIAFKS